jgi:hypothetical protein
LSSRPRDEERCRNSTPRISWARWTRYKHRLLVDEALVLVETKIVVARKFKPSRLALCDSAPQSPITAGVSAPLNNYLGAHPEMIDRHYGHLARDGREHAISLLDQFTSS